jgi:serine/threonine protein kinase
MTSQNRCPVCQNDLTEAATSCPSCGTLIEAPFEDATRRLDSPRSSKTRSPSYDSIDDSRFVPGTMLAERYRIVGLLGRGGMGEVYRADDLKLGQPVALKFLPDRLLNDGASLARFHREVRVARQVSHKNVCRVYDIGEINGHHFLSMEYIKGEELSSLLRRIGRLPADKAVQISRQICAGLSAAHESGVLHRDLKPSNVMIDAEGNARITDFGLAGLAEEFRDEELGAGTPAYMAPEQLEGTAATVRSDIYSLGLVLYELFTGKKAFEADSFDALIKLRRGDTTPTTPTSIVKDLDPVIERVIERCMEKDPSLRPSTALQVAAALPGGDPIAAALAAGETPSPEMVAAASKKGTLPPPVALGLLASVLLLLAISTLLSKGSAAHRLIPLKKSPDVLSEQAGQIARSLGYSTPPADVVGGFEPDFEYYQYLSKHRSSISPREALKSAQPGLVRFWYRQSPIAFVPNSYQFVTPKDPPNEIPGMVRISVDTEGKLFFLEAVPDQIEREAREGDREKVETTTGEVSVASSPSSTDSPDWSTLFTLAGLDISKFQPVQSVWTPPHAYDTRQAWSGTYPGLPQIPMSIEAAAYRGRPVYFQIISPWTTPLGKLSQSVTAFEKLSAWLLLGLFFATMIVAGFLALRNLRMGRGDRRGAFRVAAFLFAIRMLYWVARTHHVASDEELMLLITGLQSALFWSCFVGLLYLALEPYLRRHWPQRIISWNRLLAGDFRDPLVGRDLLIGAAFGSLCVTLMVMRPLVPQWFGFDPGMPDVTDGFESRMAGIADFAQLSINQISASVGQAFMVVFLLLFLSLLFRRDWLGIGVGFLILTSLFVSGVGREHPVALILIPITMALFVLCAMRFGPLALMSCLTVFHLWIFFPMTTELSAWYATVFLLEVALLLGLTVYGFYTSLAGQPVFGRSILKEG